MSASRKPQPGEAISLSAAALGDAYRAADIVLGKDGGFTSRVDEKKLNWISVQVPQAFPPWYPDYKIGDAIILHQMEFGDLNTNAESVENEEDLIKFEAGCRYMCKRNSAGHSYRVGYNFGIVMKKTYQDQKQILKVQIRGLLICRCLLFAEAEAIGPPIRTEVTEYQGYNYPVGNYYGDAKIIARGRFYKITQQEYPRIQECLIDLG